MHDHPWVLVIQAWLEACVESPPSFTGHGNGHWYQASSAHRMLQSSLEFCDLLHLQNVDVVQI